MMALAGVRSPLHGCSDGGERETKRMRRGRGRRRGRGKRERGEEREKDGGREKGEREKRGRGGGREREEKEERERGRGKREERGRGEEREGRGETEGRGKRGEMQETGRERGKRERVCEGYTWYSSYSEGNRLLPMYLPHMHMHTKLTHSLFQTWSLTQVIHTHIHTHTPHTYTQTHPHTSHTHTHTHTCNGIPMECPACLLGERLATASGRTVVVVVVVVFVGVCVWGGDECVGVWVCECCERCTCGKCVQVRARVTKHVSEIQKACECGGTVSSVELGLS